MADRSWTIAPALVWFGAAVTLGIYALDGDFAALANRLTQKRTEQASGPTIGQPAIAVEPDDDDTDNEPEAKPQLPAGSHDVDALDDVCIDGTDDACKRWAMDAFYRAVDQTKSGSLGRALRVSWFGDSVVATDAIPGRLRTRLQTELGDGGPGYVFIVPPHRFCGHEAITRHAIGSWGTHAISTTLVADGLYGYGGSTFDAQDGDGRVTFKLVAGKASRVELHYLAQPKGGSATIGANDGEVLRAETAGDDKHAAWASATIEGGASSFKLTAEGKVRLFGVSLENERGAVVDNLGIVSIHVKSFGANDADHWAAEIEHRSPDLVMIMIGANEAQWLQPHDQDTRRYREHYEKLLAPIRKGRPDGSCLVVSPTDQAEAKDGSYPSRPVMPLLVEAQRAAAHAKGCAFYSTYHWMGGRGSAAKWFRKKLVGSDFQHLSRTGANKMADAVFDALMHGYQRHVSEAK